MSVTMRPCADCTADITGRGLGAKRCEKCARARVLAFWRDRYKQKKRDAAAETWDGNGLSERRCKAPRCTVSWERYPKGHPLYKYPGNAVYCSKTCKKRAERKRHRTSPVGKAAKRRAYDRMMANPLAVQKKREADRRPSRLARRKARRDTPAGRLARRAEKSQEWYARTAERRREHQLFDAGDNRRRSQLRKEAFPIAHTFRKGVKRLVRLATAEERKQKKRCWQREYEQRRRAADPEWQRRKTRRRRARIGGKKPRRFLPDAIARQNGICTWCNLPLPDDLSEIHADHIHPVSKGGETSLENTAALHAACNLAKGAKAA